MLLDGDDMLGGSTDTSASAKETADAGRSVDMIGDESAYSLIRRINQGTSIAWNAVNMRNKGQTGRDDCSGGCDWYL